MRLIVTLFALLAAASIGYLSYSSWVGAQDPLDPPTDRGARLDAFQRIIGECEQVILGVENGNILLIPFALDAGDNVYSLEEFARMTQKQRDSIKTSPVPLPMKVDTVRQQLAAAKYSQESIDSFVRNARRASQDYLSIWKNRRAAAFEYIDQLRSPPTDVDVDPIKSHEKKTSEVKPSEPKPGETKPGETKPSETKPEEKSPPPVREEKNPPRTEFREEKNPEEKTPEIKKEEPDTRPAAGIDDLVVFTYTDGNQPKPGTIEQLNRTTWIETTPKGVIYRYREMDRTKEYVELHDAARGVSLRVFASKVMLRHPDLNGGDWADWRQAKQEDRRQPRPNPFEKNDDEENLSYDDEVRRLLGTWKFVSVKIAGKETAVAQMAPVTFLLRGDVVTFSNRVRGELVESRCKINLKESPKEIDLQHTQEYARGIYKFADGKLVICFAKSGLNGSEPRPTEFVSDASTPTALMVLAKVPGEEEVAPPRRFEEKKAEDKSPGKKEE